MVVLWVGLAQLTLTGSGGVFIVVVRLWLLVLLLSLVSYLRVVSGPRADLKVGLICNWYLT